MKAISLQRIAEINSTPRNSNLSRAYRKLEKLSEDAKDIKVRLAQLKENYNSTRQKMTDEKGGAFYASARGFVQEMQASGITDRREIIKKAGGRIEKAYVSDILKLQDLVSAIELREEKLEDIRKKYSAQVNYLRTRS